MKKLSSFFLILIFTFASAYSQRDEIELVESVPVETDLDNTDIRDTYEVWMEMINNSKSSLDIEQFYISNRKGELFEDVLSAIIASAKRGIPVRIIVDSRMHRTYPETVAMLGKQKNITIRVINFEKLSGGIQHSKYFIVDNEEIFLGSQNFDWRALTHIHEIGIRVREKNLVSIYKDIFQFDWNYAENNDPSFIEKSAAKRHSGIPVTVNSNPGDSVSLFPTMSPIGMITDSTLWDERNIVDLIDHAADEVCCQFLTYTPVGRDKSYYHVIDNALRRASVRGVKVKIMVSDWSIGNPAVDHLKSLALLPNIEIKFSSIPEWSGGYIPYARVDHCKFLIADGKNCWIGTSNCEKSYFYTSRNIGIIIHGGSISQKLLGIFRKSWDGSYTESIRPESGYLPRYHGE